MGNKPTTPATTTSMDRPAEPTPMNHWHEWGSPVGLGLGLVAIGGLFVLVALGLSVLSSIGTP